MQVLVYTYFNIFIRRHPLDEQGSSQNTKHKSHTHVCFDHGEEHAKRAEKKRGAVEIRSGESSGGDPAAISALLGVGRFSCSPKEDGNRNLCFCETEGKPVMAGAQESGK